MKTVKILQLPFTESLKPFFSVTYYNYIYIDKNLRTCPKVVLHQNRKCSRSPLGELSGKDHKDHTFENLLGL